MALKDVDTMSLDGGCICFDFTNTVNSRTVFPLHEYIRSYADLLTWSKRVKALTENRLEKLQEMVYGERETASAISMPGRDEALEYFRQAREVLYRFFSAVAAGQSPDRETAGKFNRLVHEGMKQLAFAGKGGQVRLDWASESPHPHEPVWAALKSAFDVLCTEDPKRIKECEACGWLFLDRTKNNRKRWCNPNTCGSADKARRYYHRKKKTRT